MAKPSAGLSLLFGDLADSGCIKKLKDKLTYSAIIELCHFQFFVVILECIDDLFKINLCRK